jgi:hypothetical protein
MIKTILRDLEQSLVEALPFGAINTLAKKHRYSRQTIAKILNGQTGEERVVKEVVESALEILERTTELQNITVAKIREKIQMENVSA